MPGKKKVSKKRANPKAAKGAAKKAAKHVAQDSPGKAAPEGKEAKDADMAGLRKKAEEAHAGLKKAGDEANALRAQAKGVEVAAKKAYAEALAPYRDACRKAGKKCELPGIKAPSTLPRARFLIEKVKGGLKVSVKDRAKSEEVIPDKKLKESIWRAARDYCARHFGKEWTGGRARGLGLRFQAALAGK